MKWKQALFKGKTVWAGVTEDGAVFSSGGRTPIRYSERSGAKIYRAGSSGLRLQDGEAVELPSGVSPDAPKPSKKSSGLGSAKTRTEAQRKRAVEVASELVSSFSPTSVVCFTDGSCRGNPGPSGLGVVVKLPDGRVLTRSEFLGKGTNNIAELSALGVAIDTVVAAGVDDSVRVEILTDSKYAHGLLTQGWKAKANRELIESIREKVRNRGNIRFHWVAGHAGIPENEQADELANQAILNR